MRIPVRFLGVGDATCGEGVHTSILYTGHRVVLIDCGPSVPQPLLRAVPDPQTLDAIWISHQHADHCFGLPTLLLTLRLAGRRRPLTLLGGVGSSAFLRELLELGYPGSFRPEKCFDLSFVEIAPGQGFDLEGLRLSSVQTQHRVPCHALRIEDGPHRICVSGDGKLASPALELYRDSDLVVHECQWETRLADDHSCVDDIRRLVDEANVRRVAIVHCSLAERRAIGERAARTLAARAWLPVDGETYEL